MHTQCRGNRRSPRPTEATRECCHGTDSLGRRYNHRPSTKAYYALQCSVLVLLEWPHLSRGSPLEAPHWPHPTVARPPKRTDALRVGGPGAALNRAASSGSESIRLHARFPARGTTPCVQSTGSPTPYPVLSAATREASDNNREPSAEAHRPKGSLNVVHVGDPGGRHASDLLRGLLCWSSSPSMSRPRTLQRGRASFNPSTPAL